MAKKSLTVSKNESAQDTPRQKIAETSIQIQTFNAAKTLSLTYTKLEQWFATLERGNKPNKHTDSYLSTQLLSRFGLKNPQEVIEFLKSPAGKTTLTMISRELMKIESLNEHQAQKNREEALLRQRRLIFLLMSVMAMRKAHAKHVSDLINLQTEKRLKEIKQLDSGKQETPKIISMAVMQETIDFYTRAIEALDAQLEELESDLLAAEEMLLAIEIEAQQMVHSHSAINAHMNQLQAYLQLPQFKNPAANPVAHATRQVASLTTQLAALRAQHEARSHAHPEDTKPQQPDADVNRKIRMIEEQLSFHQNQLKQPQLSAEQVFVQLLEQVRARLNEQQQMHANKPQVTHPHHEIEGLRLQERGLHDALRVAKKERILLNAQLQEVHDFSQAQFIIDPNERSRYMKKGDSYVVLEDDDNSKDLTGETLLQAKLRFEQVKTRIQVVNAFYHDKMQHEKDDLNQRKGQHLKVKAGLLNQIQEVNLGKARLMQSLSEVIAQRDSLNQTPALTPFSMTPTPSPKQEPKSEKPSSYALMMKSLVPVSAPAPQTADISRVREALQTVIPARNQGELKQLINEVTPGVLMAPDLRLSWLNRARRLIPDIPAPELDSTFGYRGKK